jgi:hypothetical protein
LVTAHDGEDIVLLNASPAAGAAGLVDAVRALDKRI